MIRKKARAGRHRAAVFVNSERALKRHREASIQFINSELELLDEAANASREKLG